jgi:hypothetical protein
MPDEPKSAGRPRPPATPPQSAPDLSALETDPAIVPATQNTPLPPLTPLPLASQPAESGTPPPQPGGWPAQADLPMLPPLPPAPDPARGAAPSRLGSSVSATWAAQTLFALIFTSIILLGVMAVVYASISKTGVILGWAFAIIVVLNLVYAVVVYNIAQPGPGQPFRLPFLTPRRGP